MILPGSAASAGAVHLFNASEYDRKLSGKFPCVFSVFSLRGRQAKVWRNLMLFPCVTFGAVTPYCAFCLIGVA